MNNTGESSGLWDAFRARNEKGVLSIIKGRRAAGLSINTEEGLRASAYYGMKEAIKELRADWWNAEAIDELPHLAKMGGFSELAEWLGEGRRLRTKKAERTHRLQELQKGSHQASFFDTEAFT